MNEISKKNVFSIEYFFIAFFPVLSLYKFIPLFDVGFAILTLILLSRLIRQDFVIQANMAIFYTMLALSVLNLLVGIFKYPDLTNSLNNTAGMVVFTLLAVVYCSPGFLEGQKFYTACKIVAIMATLFIIYQFIAYYAFDVVISGKIPLLVQDGKGFLSMSYGRPNSLFYEPAHYAIYVAPVYAMAILRKEYKLMIFLFVGVVLSTSTTGIVLLVLIPMVINIRNVKLLAYLLFFILLSLLSFFYLPDFLSDSIAKLTLEDLAVNIRVFGTFSFFQYFKPPEWVFGVGINRLAEFLMINGEYYGRNYANSLVFMVLSFGLFGAAIFINLLISMLGKINGDRRIMWLILLFVLASDQILFNRNLLYLFIWVTIVTIPPLNGENLLLKVE